MREPVDHPGVARVMNLSAVYFLVYPFLVYGEFA